MGHGYPLWKTAQFYKREFKKMLTPMSFFVLFKISVFGFNSFVWFNTVYQQ